MAPWSPIRAVACPALGLPDHVKPRLHVPKHPFIPADKASRQARCAQIFDLQATALAAACASPAAR